MTFYPIKERLAYEFREEMARQLTPDQWRAMCERNATTDYAGPVCASHDFCDANMVMAAAFLKVAGRPILPDDGEGMADADCQLWNEAWSMAKRQHFTAPCWGAMPVT